MNFSLKESEAISLLSTLYVILLLVPVQTLFAFKYLMLYFRTNIMKSVSANVEQSLIEILQIFHILNSILKY